jgi:hypothetical protein
MLREADWGPYRASIEENAWALLNEALDELEKAEPGVHNDLAGKHHEVIGNWRAGLGLGPEPN